MTSPLHHAARRLLLACLLPLLAAAPAGAQVGVQRSAWTAASVDGSASTGGAQPALVWYPTATPGRTQQFGPFEVTVAPGAAPSPGAHPLVLLSHGTGGQETGHAWLAQRLVAEGYVVATFRHPGDNYLDRSAVGRPDFFTERPRQVSRVLDQLLSDARWAPLIDPRRIAAIGHSAGGYTVLALAGGRPDLRRVQAHCGAQGEGLRDDTEFCRLAGFDKGRPAAPPAPHATAAAVSLPDLHDARIRAVVAVAPVGIALDPDALAAVTLPVLVAYGARDTVLVPRFHAEAVCRALPAAPCERSTDAGHFALFQAGTGPLGSAAGDPAEDPAGFDRRAWQAAFWPTLRDFLARTMP